MIVPKYILFRHQNLSILNIAYDVLGGVASWFVAALVIAKLLLILLAKIFRKNIILYLAAGGILALGGVICGQYDPTPFPWFYKSGMIAVWLMALGGVWCRFENRLSITAQVVGIAISGIVIGLFSYFGFVSIFAPMSANCTIFGTIECIAVCFLVIVLCHVIPRNPVGKFIGRNSILYYFLCNASPAFVCVLFFHVTKVASTPYWVMVLAFVSLLLSTAIAAIIKYRFPFLLDVRKLRKYSDNEKHP